jgi:hypothetical protein
MRRTAYILTLTVLVLSLLSCCGLKGIAAAASFPACRRGGDLLHSCRSPEICCEQAGAAHSSQKKEKSAEGSEDRGLSLFLYCMHL